MNNKLALSVVALSTCLITTSNFIEATNAQRSVPVDATFLSKHHEPFKAFIRSMSWQKKIVDGVSWVPGGKRVIQIGAQFAGYAKEIKDLPYLDRYFESANESKQTLIIDSLKTAMNYQKKATEYLSNVFDALARESDQGRDTFLRVLHEQNIKMLGLAEGTTRVRLCQLVNIRFADGRRAIEDDAYFMATTLSLLTLYLYENNQKR